jgi:hypothetical protein
MIERMVEDGLANWWEWNRTYVITLEEGKKAVWKQVGFSVWKSEASFSDTLMCIDFSP